MLDLTLALFCVINTGLIVYLARIQAQERQEWNRERNALLERLVPGSTPQEPPAAKEFVLGDDRQEYLLSVDEETRAQLEFVERNGRVEA